LNESDRIQDICRNVAQRRKTVSELARAHGLEYEHVKQILDENVPLLKRYRMEEELKNRKAVTSLFKLSVKAMRQILETPHRHEIKDKNGMVKEIKVDISLMRMKKDISEMVVDETLHPKTKKRVTSDAMKKKKKEREAAAERRADLASHLGD
jgi:hypothetical protein